MLKGTHPDIDSERLSRLWNDTERLRQELNESGWSEMTEALFEHLERDCRILEQYRSFLSGIKQPGDKNREKMDDSFRSLLREWFQSKIVVVWDVHAQGNRIVKRIVNQTPPGFRNRIMGLQNIKGTGLDFVYCWQKWEQCHKACTQLRSGDALKMEEGLRVLSSFQDYGVLSEAFVRETIETVKHSSEAQTEKVQAGLIMIESNLNNVMADIHAQQSVQFSGGWVLKCMEAIESFLDAGDAIKRRKTANRIYKDLIDERISHERAAQELQALNKRQKGGWLFNQFNDLTVRLKKRVIKKLNST
jgi:hypothetical protein